MNKRSVVVTDRIIVADDHPMFRDALSQSLRNAYPDAAVAEAENLPDALKLARDHGPPSLFVLDLVFPGMEGPVTIGEIRREFPAASIIVVTMLEDQLVAQQMLDSGADGYLGKGLSSSEIIKGIRAVRAGEFVINVTPAAPVAAFDKPVFTPRQVEILRLLQDNRPTKLIARDLGLSHFTVRNHIAIIMRSLKVRRRSQIHERALALDLIAPSNAHG